MKTQAIMLTGFVALLVAGLLACESAPPGGGTPGGSPVKVDSQCVEQCSSIGWCKADGPLCVPTEAGCKASKRCKVEGICTHDPLQGDCVADDAGCAASEVCIDDGWCCAWLLGCAACE